MDKNYIEFRSRKLIGEILARSAELWPGKQEISFADVVDPAMAARVLGVDYQLHPELRWFTRPFSPLEETAGILDREGSRILIAEKFKFETRRFTAAHEIGHLLLHDGVEETIMHRDRPIDGLTREDTARPWYEREANHFAACFLVPRKRLKEAFQYVFSTNIPFVFDDAAAFELCRQDPDSLLRPDDETLARGLALASATHFRGKHFVPLHQQFRVSVTSMAIRIEELGLIQQ